MVAQSGAVFPTSLEDILANPVEIFFGSFMVNLTVLVAVTFPATAAEFERHLLPSPFLIKHPRPTSSNRMTLFREWSTSSA
jgi:hypothetical protein